MEDVSELERTYTIDGEIYRLRDVRVVKEGLRATVVDPLEQRRDVTFGNTAIVNKYLLSPKGMREAVANGSRDLPRTDVFRRLLVTSLFEQAGIKDKDIVAAR